MTLARKTQARMTGEAEEKSDEEEMNTDDGADKTESTTDDTADSDEGADSEFITIRR